MNPIILKIRICRKNTELANLQFALPEDLRSHDDDILGDVANDWLDDKQVEYRWCRILNGDECRKLAEENRTEMNNENWIDVNKELPKQRGDYLVMADEMDVMTFYPDAPDLWSSWQARGHKSGGDVTHWMELPDKPKM